MTNNRIKKGENNPQSDSKDLENATSRDDAFLNSKDDELAHKRKMILTGITTGVGVAGVSAAALLFLGPYSPFGMKNEVKQDNIASESSLQQSNTAAETTSVLPPPPPEIASSQSSTTLLAAPVVLPEVVKESPKKQVEEKPQAQKAPIVAVAPAPKQEASKETIKSEPKAKVVAPVPLENNKDVSSYNYDIQDGGPVVEATPKKKIQVSRDFEFRTLYLNGEPDSKGKYRISNPPPGEIFWTEDGKKIHKITIVPPMDSGIKAEVPSKMKINEQIQWNSSGKVSFYRVEISHEGNFDNRVKVFSTIKKSLPANLIGVGNWFVRISALNLQSGTWDFAKTFSLQIENTDSPPSQQEAKKSETTSESSATSNSVEASKATEPVEPIEPKVEIPAQQDNSPKPEEPLT